jgi:Domain of unknown function (DUF4382)
MMTDSGSRTHRQTRFFAALGLSAIVALALAAMGGAATAVASAPSGKVTTTISNAPTCSGGFQHIWVTVSDVRAHKRHANWQDLTPDLAANPIQVDLLNEAPTDCFLATLGFTSGLPPGKYQQIRIILFDGTTHGKRGLHGKAGAHGHGHHGPPVTPTPPATNACSSIGVYNCVDTGSGLFPIKLTSEAKTGLKIPPGQIAGHGLVIASGQGADLDIDFNACQSIKKAGKSGKYILKPTLHAGEVDTTAIISGVVVEGNVSNTDVVPDTASPVAGANLWLESQTPPLDYTVGTPAAAPTPVTAQVENVVRTTTSAADGSFGFCPMPAGTYEIVSDSSSMPSTGGSSNATITTGVVVTNSGGPNDLVIPLLADETAPATPATLQSIVTTENSTTPPGAGDNVALAGVQPFDGDSGIVQAIVPPLTGTLPAPGSDGLPSVTTTSAVDAANCSDAGVSAAVCPTGTNCACFTLALPASNPVIGSASSGTYAAPAPTPAVYSVTGAASSLTTPGAPECAPSTMITDPASPLAVPAAIATPILSFGACD